PEITGEVEVADITQTSAIVRSQTIKDTTTAAEALFNAEVKANAGVEGHRREHAVPLTGLVASTTYTARVKSSFAGKEVTAEKSFTTLPSSSVSPSPSSSVQPPISVDTTPPVITNERVVVQGNGAATATWTTDEPATTTVTLTTPGLTARTFNKVESATTHSIGLTNVPPGSHTGEVESRDVKGNVAKKPVTFTMPAGSPSPSSSPVASTSPLPSPSSLPSPALALQTLTLNSTTANSNSTAQAMVTLSGQAPAGGVPVTLASTNTNVATVPATVTVPAGSTNAPFTITTKVVSSNTPVTVRATLGTVTKEGVLTVQVPLTPTSQFEISDIQVPAASLTTNAATITWRTNVPATTEIDAGPSDAYGVTTTDPNRTTTHSATLRGLVPGSTYHYRVRSVDAAGNRQQSSDATFTTKFDATPIDNVQPVISNVVVSARTTTTATISWLVTDASSTQEFVAYGTTGAYGQRTTSTTSRTVTLTSLTPTTTYHYQVNSIDVAGNVALTQDLTFTTAAEPAPLPVVQAVTLASETVMGGSIANVTIHLNRPAPTGGVVVALSSTSTKVQVPPTVTISAGSQNVDFSVATGTVTENTPVTITALLNNSSQSAVLTLQPVPIQPTDTTPPVISQVAAVEIAKNSAR
ncbi:MAG: fibronectin type III domain-containing protein, partial [Candidatus Andersenbacteria bacterium]